MYRNGKVFLMRNAQDVGLEMLLSATPTALKCKR